jgi:molybdenum cofactor guanylyltransferase
MIAALILAGGNGSRLGGVDKAFLDLNGQSLITHLLNRLTRQVKKIAISANGDTRRFDPLDLEVLPDGPFLGVGPLAGVARGLEWAEQQMAESLITIPVDTPFIPLDLVERLTPAPSVAVFGGRQHHLVAHWQISARPSLMHFLEIGAPYKVRNFLRVCDARQISFDGPRDPFLNINAPDDFESARARLETEFRDDSGADAKRP